MAFFSGNTTMDALVDKLADELIATGAWGTADATLVAGASPAKRAVQHLTDASFFVTIERILSSVGNVRYNEIKVRVSTGFDTALHVPSGTVEVTGIPAEGWQSNNTSIANYDGSSTGTNKSGTYYLWVDAAGIAVLATWAPVSNHFDFTSALFIERITTKEYADGYSNFFVAAWTNADSALYTGSTASGYFRSTAFDLQRKQGIRPFSGTTTDNYTTMLETFFGAYRSPGNSKIYLQFPYFSNTTASPQRTPIAQSKKFFLVALGVGLGDGDTVNVVVGAETWTYLVKTLQSPESTNYLSVAIRQA